MAAPSWRIADDSTTALVTGLRVSSPDDVAPYPIEQLAACLRAKPMVTRLDLSHCTLGVAATIAVADMLSASRLVSLNLKRCKLMGDPVELIDFSGIDALGRAIQSCTTLTELDLSDNQLTVFGEEMKGVAELAVALRGHPALRSLSLASNALFAEGTRLVADAIGSTGWGDSCLTHLDLSDTQVTRWGSEADGIVAIAEMLEKSATLQSLCVEPDLSVRHEGAGTPSPTACDALDEALSKLAAAFGKHGTTLATLNGICLASPSWAHIRDRLGKADRSAETDEEGEQAAVAAAAAFPGEVVDLARRPEQFEDYEAAFLTFALRRWLASGMGGAKLELRSNRMTPLAARALSQVRKRAQVTVRTRACCYLRCSHLIAHLLCLQHRRWIKAARML